MEQTTLYFIEGQSDKVYRAAIEAQGDGYIVTFAYGRRGGKLTTGTRTKSPVALEQARAIYNKLVAEKKAKGYAERDLWQFQVQVVRCMFSIEPRKRFIPEGEEDISDREYRQGFVYHPRVLEVCADDVWTMTLDCEISATVPSLDGVEMAFCVPFDVVEDEGLYYRHCDDGDDSGVRLPIPRGSYDLLVRIYPTEGTGEDEDADEDEDESDDDFDPRCKASFTFLPRGTIGLKCFRRGFGKPVPDRLVLRTADGGTEEFPN